MELLEYIADVGTAIFIGVASWVGIFLMTALTLQWVKDTLVERKRVKEAAKQDAWRID